MNLTPIEIRMLNALVRYDGTTVKQCHIAARMCVSEHCLKNVLYSVRKKTHIHSTSKLVVWWRRRSITMVKEAR